MTDDSLGSYIFVSLFVIGAAFGIGWCVGNDTTTKSIRQDICKIIMTQTDDYINCNTWDMGVIYKKIGEK